ncbi:hypothetical protein AYR53_06865 [Loigolactobacillus backii]|uniref:Glycosyltransferase 2-like domain-containing protein n=1 Tax=Loigolactobacillus backii TaxID=375175 RepID=A0A192H2C1_9LACO|nr:glycosyltransferase family 2 protein [Loigolactobacillus backii]ANK62510.1 hypothetical protein AYR53_06865 [Loigolactobacillus backii]
MIKFSIITSAFNAEKYIGASIKSVLANNYPDFELIIIDDGSTDNTMKIIRSFDEKKIRIISLKHVGPANARNTGIKRATGDFILFLDSDDILAVNVLSTLNSRISKQNYDFVIFQWLPFKKEIGDTRELPHATNSIDGMETTIWNKAYSINLVKEIEFPSDTTFEDVAYSAQAYIRAKNIGYIKQTLYYLNYSP